MKGKLHQVDALSLPQQRRKHSADKGSSMTPHDRPLRLGFPVKVMGRPDLKSQDTRGWRKNPHLKCSLELLDGVLDYLRGERLDMYRMSSDIAPYATHPDMPQFTGRIASRIHRGRVAATPFGGMAKLADRP